MKLSTGGFEDLCDQVCARLPELEWRLSQLGTILHAGLLPRGLFTPSLNLDAQHCIADIKHDVVVLAQQKQRQRAYYLADRIHQKIEVLVRFCNLNRNKMPAANRTSVFTLDALSTRQQWLSGMQARVSALTEQQAALKNADHMLRGSTESRLRLDAELGDVTQKLTLAQESLLRAESS